MGRFCCPDRDANALTVDRRRRIVGHLAAVVMLSVMTVSPSVSAQGTPPAGIVVSGTVYDSIARQRIGGVTVQLVNADDPAAGRPFTAVADSSGRYTIRGVPAGRYLAGFFHAALDTLGLESPPRTVQLTSATERLDLATPSPKTVLRTVCRDVNPDSAGLYMGHVRDTEAQTSIEAATVIVEWSEFVLDGVRVYERPRTVTGRTAEPGWFAFCGLPTDVVLLSRVAHGADTSGYVQVDVPAGGLRYQSFLVGGASRVTLPRDTASEARGLPAAPPRVVARGGARLTGTIVDPTGKPVANAHALVWGTDLDVQTNDRGVFTLEGLPGGTQTLEIRVIGYVPVTRAVHLASSRPATVEVKLDRAAVILATETVRGKLVYSRQLVDFERRRQSGFGRYMSTEELERRPNTRLSQVLQGMLGVYVQQSGGQSQVLMRGSTTGYCSPTLYVDGNRDLSGDYDYLYTDEIAGIEVYARESLRPGGYTDMIGCGAVLVWTRPRATRVKKNQ